MENLNLTLILQQDLLYTSLWEQVGRNHRNIRTQLSMPEMGREAVCKYQACARVRPFYKRCLHY